MKINKLVLLVFSLVLAVLAIYILFYNLGHFPLENWDEAFYGQVTKEMLQTKNFITPHWDYQIWLDKPPMYMWVVSLVSILIGLSELAIRLPSAVSAFVIIGIATVYVYKKYSILASVFTFFTLLLNNVFTWRARSGNLDLLASLFIFISYLLLISKNKYKYPLLGLIFAFIYLTKASLVVLPFSIFVVSEIFYEYKNFRKNIKEYLKLLVIFLGISGLWLLLAYFQAGGKFVSYYLFQSDQGVAALSKFNPNYLLYVYYALQRRFFWLFLIGLFFALLKIKQKQYFLLIAYSCLLILQLSFTSRDNNWYLIPAMPFWSITIGLAAYSILKIFQRKKILYYSIAFIMLLISSYICYKTLVINILPILNSSTVQKQAESGKLISKLSKTGEVVVRLDNLISTTLYYDNRRTLDFAWVIQTNDYWISKEDLLRGIKEKKINWLVGTDSEAEAVMQMSSPSLFQRIQVNSEETILKTK